MATPNLSEIITTTLRNRSGKLADNVSKGNAILFKLKEQGRVEAGIRPHDRAGAGLPGRQLPVVLAATRLINITPPDVLTAAEFNWKQAYASVSISGLEKEVQNVGKEQVINLLEARIKNAERTMKNHVTVGMYATGTGNSAARKSAACNCSWPTPRPPAPWAASIARRTRSGATSRIDAVTDGGCARRPRPTSRRT
jgi:hypothetical protein